MTEFNWMLCNFLSPVHLFSSDYSSFHFDVINILTFRLPCPLFPPVNNSFRQFLHNLCPNKDVFHIIFNSFLSSHVLINSCLFITTSPFHLNHSLSQQYYETLYVPSFFPLMAHASVTYKTCLLYTSRCV